MAGLNVAADGRHTGAWVQAAGADAVRIVLTREHDLQGRLRDYQDHGIFVLGVVARESLAGFTSWGEALRCYHDRHGDAIAYQLGNESDLESPSSWQMSPYALSLLGQTARIAMPNATLVCAGLASGQPGWLADVDLSSFDAVACHPYAKNAIPDDDLPDAWSLVWAYRRYGLPVWISEYGWWSDDEERGEREVRAMVEWATTSGEVERYFHFCADDAMVAPFGLYRTDGSPKPAAIAFREACGVASFPAPVQLPAPVGWVGPGLQAELDRLGWTPTTDEHDETLRLVRAGEDLVVWDGERGALAYRRAQ